MGEGVRSQPLLGRPLTPVHYAIRPFNFLARTIAQSTPNITAASISGFIFFTMATFSAGGSRES